jgi:ArsR family transcriptional regulator
MPLGSGALMPQESAIWLAIRLKALADPMRLQLLAHLLRQPEGEDCTCNLAPLVNLSEPTVSHHLKRLESAGLLIKQRRGSSVYYRVVPEAITAIAQVLHVGR